jgi:hypothetical protein
MILGKIGKTLFVFQRGDESVKSPGEVIHNPDEHEAIYKAVASRKPEMAIEVDKETRGGFSKEMVRLKKIKTFMRAKPISIVKE